MRVKSRALLARATRGFGSKNFSGEKSLGTYESRSKNTCKSDFRPFSIKVLSANYEHTSIPNWVHDQEDQSNCQFMVQIEEKNIFRESRNFHISQTIQTFEELY